MGHLKDTLIEREEYAQAARGRCRICGEKLQQGEEEICYIHVRYFEND
jgi:hypothetical protein